MNKPSRCLLLLNVGTPDTPQRADIRRYLSEFLNDKYVIDLPWLFRKLLVNGVIIPFRVNTSVKIYEELWAKHGRILDTLTQRLVTKLQQYFENKIAVKYAMRYGNPSISKAVQEIKAAGYDELVLFPLFAHNAMSTRTTAINETLKQIEKAGLNLKIELIPAFFRNPQFIKALVAQLESRDYNTYDHILFSYHGLPNRHIRKAHKEINYPLNGKKVCEVDINFEEKHLGCYKAECYETSRLLAQEMGLPKEKYTTAFQSRLSKDWLRPFSDETILKLLKEGAKRILVFTPAFVIDCLESVNEIGEEYAEDFYKAGGEQLDLVPCLNDSQEMVAFVGTLLKSYFSVK